MVGAVLVAPSTPDDEEVLQNVNGELRHVPTEGLVCAKTSLLNERFVLGVGRHGELSISF